MWCGPGCTATRGTGSRACRTTPAADARPRTDSPAPLWMRKRASPRAAQARKLAFHFVAFLEHLAAASPGGRLYLALDGAPAHTAKVVERWLAAHPRLIVLRLPPYAAHQEHPVERIWGLMQDAVAADRLEGSITVLVVAARQFFTELAPHPVKLPLVA